MNKKKQIIVALVIAAAALLLNKAYIDSRISEQAGSQKKVQVIVAKQRIQQGLPLRRNMVQPVWVPEKYAPKARIRLDSFAQFDGLELNTDVIQGDYVLQNYFRTETTGGATLSAQVQGQNFRAVSLPVDETNSLARSIVSGDRIDIVFTFTSPVSRQAVSIVLLQNVPVIATGSYLLNDVGEKIGSQRYNTLTLKLSMSDAVKLNYGRQQGKLSILLRNPKDDATMDVAPIASVLDLLNPEEREKIKNVQPEMSPENFEANLREQLKTLMDLQRKQQGGK